VAQQRAADSRVAPKRQEDGNSEALEVDADRSASSAVASLWSGLRESATDIARNATPRLKSGLSLQRCSNDEKNKFEEVKKILNQSQTGQEALANMKKYDVKVKKGTPGGGSEYKASGNAMVIDPNESATETALTFVHEMHHATMYHEGKWADVKTLSRRDYITKEIEEESEGTVKSIETKIELEGTKIDVSKATFPLEKEYRTAYKAAVDAAKAKDPKTSEEDLKRIGREAGRKRVIKGFWDGEVVISTSKAPVTYPDYYGKIWDDAHKGSP
jgi:hypothetical protein